MGNGSSLNCLSRQQLNNRKKPKESEDKLEKTQFIISKKESDKSHCERAIIDRNNNIVNNGIFRGAKRIFARKTNITNVSGGSIKNDKRDSFLIHGIDYLPEAMKRRERRRKNNVPKFLVPPLFSIFQNHEHRPSNPVNYFNKNDSTNSNRKITAGNHLSNTNKANNIGEGASEEDWKSFENFPFHNLVMSGGGSKGYAYIGALKALEDCGMLKRVKRLAGSSAGAICAGLLAVGCSPQEIADVFKCDIKWLFHDQRCVCCCLPGMYNDYGVHPAKRFHRMYGQHLRRKAGSADITFKQVYEERGVELCVVVTNLSRMCSEYCSHTTMPHLPIRDAVRMSMSFPVMYRAVRATISGMECLYTDGGLLDQYPITYFDDASRFAGKKNEDAESTDVVADDDDVVDEEGAVVAHAQASNNNNPGDVITLVGDVMSNKGTGGDGDVEGGRLNYETLGLYVVSERAVDHKIWRALFDCHIPYRPTYLPNTKLARARLKNEMSIRKLHDKQFNKHEFMEDLAMTADVRQHYELMHKSHVDIRSLSEYFMTAIEALLISQRKVRVRQEDRLRTVAINCGYIGTNDYQIEPPDREFMIDQGYSCTVKYLKDFIQRSLGKT